MIDDLLDRRLYIYTKLYSRTGNFRHLQAASGAWAGHGFRGRPPATQVPFVDSFVIFQILSNILDISCGYDE